MRRARRSLFAAAAAIAVVVATPLAASAQTLVPLSVVTSVGTDVSYPQCGTTPVTTPAFTVVGVNEGLPNTTNSCLADELTQASVSGDVSLYVNTADPGVHEASWWPRSNRTQHDSVSVSTPYGTCRHTTSSACAYVYGYSMAHDDLVHRGVAKASTYRWWLDVETSNTWNGGSAVDRADLEGMVAAFHAAHAAVGIYSTHTQFHAIVGTTPSSSRLAKLQSWLSGSTTQAGANAQCATAALTPGGRVTMAQYTPLTLSTASVDEDILCLRLATAQPTISGVAAPRHRLTAHVGTWTAGTALSYQWRRSGRTISGATHSTYTPAKRDLGHSITVRVSGRQAGYDLSARTSRGVTIATALTRTPTPTITGTKAVGHVLAAHAGSWKPSHVTLHYQWRRNGVAIHGATHAHYRASQKDAGAALTVAVRGTKHGYASVTKTSSAVTIGPLTVQAGAQPVIRSAASTDAVSTVDVGATLTATTGTWSTTGIVFAYQWTRDGVAIDGQTAATYVTTTDDAGQSVSVEVTASRPDYVSTTVASANAVKVQLPSDAPVLAQGAPVSN